MGLLFLFSSACLFAQTDQSKNKTMIQTISDEKALSRLNARFIQNFIDMHTAGHNEIIHTDFICINGNGTVSNRKEYMEGWARGYINSGYTSFGYTDEFIRIFNNIALVIAKTRYTKLVNGEAMQGTSIYTDTYIKEKGRWWCVQAHITPVKQ